MSAFGKDLCERVRLFAVAVIRLSTVMPRNAAGWEIARQMVRSSNSIAANLEEAQGCITSPDFLYKVNLARKEARETHMWLRNTKDSQLITNQEIDRLITEANEIVSILVSSVKTLQRKRNMERNNDRPGSTTRDSQIETRDSKSDE